MIIYSLRPASVLSDFAQRKTNPKSEMTRTDFSRCLGPPGLLGAAGTRLYGTSLR